mmetsp:Transcript_15336/g.19903  ORF Transcript_15336/g.19903 Transcript_15336/m.19903 type:complete len:416 (+) Transcript_15336:127-1374(+)
MPIIFKINFEKTGEKRRFPATTSFAELSKSLVSFWGDHPYVLTYKDEDGDSITVTSEIEFREALAVADIMKTEVIKFDAFCNAHDLKIRAQKESPSSSIKSQTKQPNMSIRLVYDGTEHDHGVHPMILSNTNRPLFQSRPPHIFTPRNHTMNPTMNFNYEFYGEPHCFNGIQSSYRHPVQPANTLKGLFSAMTETESPQKRNISPSEQQHGQQQFECHPLLDELLSELFNSSTSQTEKNEEKEEIKKECYNNEEKYNKEEKEENKKEELKNKTKVPIIEEKEDEEDEEDHDDDESSDYSDESDSDDYEGTVTPIISKQKAKKNIKVTEPTTERIVEPIIKETTRKSTVSEKIKEDDDEEEVGKGSISVSQKVTNFNNQLDELASMGFHNRHVNLTLLNRFDGDVLHVLNYLLETI